MSTGAHRHLIGWLVCAVSLALLLPCSPPPCLAAEAIAGAEGHRPGLRDQWQPQTEHDARLAQPVQTEVLGRAAVPALEILSKQTGVTLRVAPENLDTIGERKLTIIAQSCSLKSIMVQVPNALQECHWDVDVTGGEPSYLLHRNGGAEAALVELVAAERAEDRPARQDRMDAVRRVLTMSPDELAQLMQTDPLLAAAAKDPLSRQYLEIVTSLPAKNLDELVRTGTTSVDCAALPRALLQRVTKWYREGVERGVGDDAQARAYMEPYYTALPQATLRFNLYADGEISCVIWYFDIDGQGGVRMTGTGPCLYSSHTPLIVGARETCQKALRAAGMSEEDAVTLLDQVEKRGEQEQEQRGRIRGGGWREPRSAELHKEITLPFEGSVDPVEVQQLVARETGLSLISDYFTAWGRQDIPEEARGPMPAWRLLSALGEKWFWSYDWNEVGNCLTFRDHDWYRRVLQELPGPMVTALRAKLKQQHQLTLDDVAAAAVELERRRPLPTELRDTGQWWMNLPFDLEQAGLPRDLRSELLLLYASLSPAQRTEARSEEGLPCRDLTVAQQALLQHPVLYGSGAQLVMRAPTAEQANQAVYRVKESAGPGSAQTFELTCDFPGHFTNGVGAALERR